MTTIELKTARDEVYYDPNLKTSIVWTDGLKFDRFTIGPTFFNSYLAFPNTSFSHGFNLKNASNAAVQNIAASAAAACKIAGHAISAFELGNEPDLYFSDIVTNPSDYVNRWLNGAKAIENAVAEACPGYKFPGFMAPSFTGTTYSQKNETVPFSHGLNSMNNINLISSHK